MPFQQVLPDLFLWTDTCNVYVLRDGDAALLIDLGDGSVVDHLKDIGIKTVEWVLFTHHHREQCQGHPRLRAVFPNAKVAGAEGERQFLENGSGFRKMAPTLNDAFTVYGSSYVRPPVEPLKVDHIFKRMDDFTWRGREFWCVETKGNSPYGMSYLLRPRGEQRFIAFSGDVMLDGARMHNWFDTEWDYGFAAGIYAIFSAAALLEHFEPSLLLPSHGPVVKDPKPQLAQYQQKLRTLTKLYLRGYDLKTFAEADQDRVSRPTVVPFVWQITPHLYKFKGPDYWPNFVMLLADSGKALVVDCGLFEKSFLDKSLALMKQRLGLKQIDAVIVTHMHGDHMLEAPHLRETQGAQIWTMDRVVAKCQYPERYDYVAPIQTYGNGVNSVTFDRVLRDGETFQWEGYSLTVDWMPGQTEFALCLHGMIDGRKVAFTGDNLFASTTDPQQTGHECVVARNSGILEEGYLYAAEYLHALQPDLILGGHCWVMPEPAALIERYRTWAMAMRDAFRALSTDDDYRYTFDPFWVRAEPYRVSVKPGASASFDLIVRNFRDRPQQHRVALHCPPGVTAEPAVVEGKFEAESITRVPVTLSAAMDAKQGVQILAFDITLDGHRHGEWFDMIVNVGDTPAPAASAPPEGGAKKY